MEGNACYKFSTIRNYSKSSGTPIRVALDIGANIGDMSLMIREYFPEANVYAFEAVQEYADIARKKTSGDSRIKVVAKAVTCLRGCLKILKAVSGRGAIGSSIITDNEQGFDPSRFELLDRPVESIQFDDLFTLFVARTEWNY